MKTKKFKKAAMLAVIVLLAITSVQALPGNPQSDNINAVRTTCVNSIPGLSQEQTNTILKMEADHQKVMDQLRDQRRATTNEKTKAEIRLEMINQRDAHRAEVQKLLTPEQQVAYNNLHQNNNHYYRQAKSTRGKGNSSGGRGFRSGSCRR